MHDVPEATAKIAKFWGVIVGAVGVKQVINSLPLGGILHIGAARKIVLRYLPDTKSHCRISTTRTHRSEIV